MGSYLVFDKKENNSKSISYAMADIIRGIKEDSKLDDKLISEDHNGFKFSKEGIATLISKLSYILEYENLPTLDEDNWFKEYKVYEYERLDFVLTVNLIYRIWTESLCDMIIYKSRYIYARWQG